MNLKEFFYIQKSDRQVVIVLLCVALAAALVYHFSSAGADETTSLSADSTSVSGITDQGRVSHAARSRHGGGRQWVDYDEKPVTAPVLSYFDPNQADTGQLLSLGLSPWLVRNILKYRASGGVFRRKEDFARLYGLTVKQYRMLEPYIRISDDYQPASSLYSRESVSSVDSVKRPQKLKAGEFLELNEADTTELKKVPGIGSWRARSIVSYRERLGGFVSADQVLEIADMPEEVVDYLRVGQRGVHKMNVNTLSLSDLRRHPYMGHARARAIVDYRRLRGPLKSLDELGLTGCFSASDLERLKPYVEF